MAGAGGAPTDAFDPKKADFQPRIGICLSHKLQAGISGWVCAELPWPEPNGPQTGYSQSTGLVSSLDNGLTPAVTLSDPYPSTIYPSGLLKHRHSQGLSTNLGQGVSFQYLNRPLPYSQTVFGGLPISAPEAGSGCFPTSATKPVICPSAWG